MSVSSVPIPRAVPLKTDPDGRSIAHRGTARRRRDRRLRSFWCHEQLAIKMAVASEDHRSAQRLQAVFNAALQVAQTIHQECTSKTVVEYIVFDVPVPRILEDVVEVVDIPISQVMEGIVEVVQIKDRSAPRIVEQIVERTSWVSQTLRLIDT